MTTGTEITVFLNERSYTLYQPSGISTGRPVLIVLHPAASYAQYFMNEYFNLGGWLKALADVYDFHLVGPQGRSRVAPLQSWNAGDSADIHASKIGVDDVGFIQDVITDLTVAYSIDADEIYILGYSNGAALLYRYIMENGSQIKEAISLAGCRLTDEDTAGVSISTAVTHVHGTADATVPYTGGTDDQGTYMNYPSVDALETFIEGKGASFTRVNLTGAAHTYLSIAAYLLSQEETSPAVMVEEMLSGATIDVLEEFEAEASDLPTGGIGGLTWELHNSPSATGLEAASANYPRSIGVSSFRIQGTGTDFGIKATGVDLSAYSHIELDVNVYEGGEARLTITDGDAVTVSVDTDAVGISATSTIQTLRLAIGTFTDPTDCTIYIEAGDTSDTHDFSVDCLRGVRHSLAGISNLIAWYQPSDLSTLYQDAYGLLAVSADADPVGLMLDKSQRLALGTELFDSAWDTEDWTDNGGGSWTLDNTSGSGDEDLTYNALYTVGNVYETRFTLSGVSGGDVEIALGTSTEYHTQDANGSYVFRHVATNATLMRIRLPIGSAATVSGISVREIAGNHVWQATDANRPVYKTAGSVHWVEKTSSTQTMGGKTDAITVNANYYIAAGLEVTAYQPSGSVTYTLLGAGISTATTRKTLAMRLGTGTTRIFTAALRVGGGTQYLANSSNGAFNLATKYVFESYHESSTLHAAIDAGTPVTTAAAEASSGTATLVFMETGSGSVRFYGGLITSEAASAEEKTQARAWINNQMGAV